MNKELYINTPLLRGRLHIAYPLISFMQHPHWQNYLFNYFLNLECHNSRLDLNLCYVSQLDTKKSSWIHYLNKYNCYLDFLAEKGVPLHEALKDEIIQSNYIYLALDDFYLPNKAVKPFHNLHINLIYGFDDTKKIYKTIGYNLNRKFIEMEINFKSVKRSFGSPVVEVFRPDYKKEYTFNKEVFLLQIHDYLFSCNNLVSAEALALDEINKNEYMYGLSVYDRVIKHIKNASTVYDVRNLYILYEWSMLNKLRVNFLSEKVNCSFKNKEFNICEKMYQEINIAQNLMLKFIHSGSPLILLKVINILQEHREDSIKFYTFMEKILE